MSEKKVLVLSYHNHPLVHQIYNELKIHCEKVIFTEVVMYQKKILKEILPNFFVLIKNLNKVIQLSKIFFSGYRSYGVQTHLLFYLNLLHIFLLDNKYTFNIIDAHWIFPAGHLATIYSKTFPKKVVITAHGSDADQRTFENPKITKIVLQTASDANVILTAEKRLYRNLKNHGIKNIILTNQFLDLFPSSCPHWANCYYL